MIRHGALAIALILSGCLGPAGSESDDRAPCPDCEGFPVPQLEPAPTFGPPVAVSRDKPGGEPMVAVAPDGAIFLIGTGPGSTPPVPGTRPMQGVWRSDDAGLTWQDVTPAIPTAGETGVDNSLAVGEDGSVYYANAAGSVLQAFASRDAGQTWELLPVPPLPAPMHRTWLVAQGPATVHLVVESLSTQNWYVRSDDAGRTWSPPVPIHAEPGFGSDLALDPATGALHLARIVFGPAPVGEPGWYLHSSFDGGATWAKRFMFGLPAQLTGSWQSLEAGPDGTLYMAWAEEHDGTSLVTYSYSADGGTTWARPRPLAPRPGSQTLPWIAAAGPGRIAAVWYAADEPGIPGQLDAPWHVDFALVHDANTDLPTRQWVRVTPEPVHEGPVCTDGPQCPSQRDRALFDFTWVAIGPDGRTHMAFASTAWDRPGAFPMYAGQGPGPAPAGADQPAGLFVGGGTTQFQVRRDAVVADLGERTALHRLLRDWLGSPALLDDRQRSGGSVGGIGRRGWQPSGRVHRVHTLHNRIRIAPRYATAALIRP